MISFKEAQELISSKAKSFGSEEVSIDDALGRILAEDIEAERDYPPFNRSVMDGIALNHIDLQNGIKQFKLIEIIFAGQANTFALKSGECYKIMTGAAVPNDADVVIKIEDVVEESGYFKLSVNQFKVNQNIALKGQDLKKGEMALQKGNLIKAATIGLLAALGKSMIKVHKLPVVNIITTGNEVIDIKNEVSSFEIYNSNLYVLKALLKENLISTQKHSHVLDDQQELKNVILNNTDVDILIITGGVSAGDADYVPDILNAIGVEKLFHKVAIKPGKPIWCGQLSNKLIVFALPGNPFSCLVTFKIFVEFYIKSSLGVDIQVATSLPLGVERNKNSSLDEFFPVLAGSDQLKPIPINGSGDIRLGNLANGLALHPAKQNQLKVGTLVDFLTL